MILLCPRWTCWQVFWLSYRCSVCSNLLWYDLLALWSDNHWLEGPEAGSRGLVTLNLWGTCWLLPIYAGFVSLRCSAVGGQEDPVVGSLFHCLKAMYGLMLMVVDHHEFLSSKFAIAKDSSLSAKSAFGSNWFVVMVWFGFIRIVFISSRLDMSWWI